MTVAARTVSVYTTVSDPKTGKVLVLTPGDEVPAWARVGEHALAPEPKRASARRKAEDEDGDA